MIEILLATIIICALISLSLSERMAELKRRNRELAERNRELEIQVSEAELDLAIAYRKVRQEEEWPDWIGV